MWTIRGFDSMFDISSDDITSGSLWRALVVVASPLLAQNLVRVAQQTIDLFWLGRFDHLAVAAVGLATPLLTLLLALVIATPFVGTQVLVSQRTGADDREGVRRAVFTGVTLATVTGIAGGLVLFVGIGPFVDVLLAVDPRRAAGGPATRMTVQYVHVLAPGVVFAALSDVVEAAYIGRGDSRAALYVNVLSVGVNVGLDPFLIFGYGPVPGLGIQGAALATVAGYLSGLVLGVAFVVRGRGGRLLTGDTVHFDPGEIREMLDIGVSPALQDASQQAIHIVMVVLVFVLGSAAGLAAYSVVIRVASLSYIPARGLKQASQSIVGQNLGARKPDRADLATRIGVATSVGLLGVVGTLQWLVPGPLTALFVPSATEAVSTLTGTGLRIVALGYPGLGALFLFQAGFNGARHTTVSLAASLVQYWGFRLPFSVVVGLALGHGTAAIFWAIALSNLLAGVGLGGYYLHRTRNGLMPASVPEPSAPGGS